MLIYKNKFLKKLRVIWYSLCIKYEILRFFKNYFSVLMLFIYLVGKVMFSSLRLMDFVVWLVDFVFYLFLILRKIK